MFGGTPALGRSVDSPCLQETRDRRPPHGCRALEFGPFGNVPRGALEPLEGIFCRAAFERPIREPQRSQRRSLRERMVPFDSPESNNFLQPGPKPFVGGGSFPTCFIRPQSDVREPFEVILYLR